MNKKLANNIRYLRKKLTLTQKELGQKIHISHSTISKWEAGEVPSLDHLKKIAEFFGVKYNDLIDKDLTSTKKSKGNISEIIFTEKIEEYDDDYLIIDSVPVKLNYYVDKNIATRNTNPIGYSITSSIVNWWKVLVVLPFVFLFLSVISKCLGNIAQLGINFFSGFDSFENFFWPSASVNYWSYLVYVFNILMVASLMLFALALIVWIPQVIMVKNKTNPRYKKYQREVTKFKTEQIGKHRLIHKKGFIANKIIHTNNNFIYKNIVDEIIDGSHHIKEADIVSIDAKDVLFIEEVKHYKSPDELKIKFARKRVNEKLTEAAQKSLWIFLSNSGLIEHRINDKHLITEAFEAKEKENARLSRRINVVENELSASKARERDALRSAGHFERKYNDSNK